MAAIVKANSSLTSGGLAVLKRAYSTDKDGKLTYSADYVCLAAYAQRHASRFRTNSAPPTAVPQPVGQLQIAESPRMVDVQIETINGLTYFRAVYVAAGDGDASYSITETSEQRNFQASETKSVTTGPPGFRTVNEATDFISFDYMSTSVTVSSNNQRLILLGDRIFLPDPANPGRSIGGPRASAGPPFNTRRTRSYTGGSTFQNQGRVIYSATVVSSTASTRNSDGTTTYSATSTGIYIAGRTSII